MTTPLKPTLALLLIHSALLLLSTGWVNAGGLVDLTDPPSLAIKQRADQLVAMTKAGYHTALFSTTLKDKFSFASGTTTGRVTSSLKSKFSFAAGASVVADYSPCTTICRQIVFATPDLIPLLNVLPSTLYGTTSIDLVVDVVEVTGTATSGLIQVYITKDPLLSLSLSKTALLVGGRPVQNSAWSLNEGSDSNFYILTTSQSIVGQGRLSVGLSGQLRPGNTKGNLGVSTVVIGSGVGEVNTVNNSGAIKIDYFNK